MTRISLVLALLVPCSLLACSSEPPRRTRGYLSELTGEECVPDPATLTPTVALRGRHAGRGGERSPTGIPGDNLDDPHSGQVDCLGDGNSGAGNDPEGGCPPPPGCDAFGCCEVPADPDAGTPPPDPEPEPTPDAGTIDLI